MKLVDSIDWKQTFKKAPMSFAYHFVWLLIFPYFLQWGVQWVRAKKEEENVSSKPGSA